MTAVLPHTCGHCPTRWGGFNTAHCGSCHETFTTVRNFDAHQVKGRCVHPRNVKPALRVVREPSVWGRVAEIGRADTAGVITRPQTVRPSTGRGLAKTAL